MSKMHTRTRAEKILILLVESGAAYCISAVRHVITSIPLLFLTKGLSL